MSFCCLFVVVCLFFGVCVCVCVCFLWGGGGLLLFLYLHLVSIWLKICKK